jgi:hypothetical protein
MAGDEIGMKQVLGQAEEATEHCSDRLINV